ncbi:hypothetical protein O1Q96_01175 (plasmid) [Streptomyces sp. Qhu-G9]|uniref:hypothetical protein n=1 Tax=Streptomyces sp. Qhu-G9 TaxID=3452799 RepID=UPI0022ABDDAB|nr:hypothetical protein [Streptomyces aurantiacus]WAU78476.1 hypothetical protein O1Q96_01175 [Streptomyces aurantiacus]
MLQLPRFGFADQAIADMSCSATTIHYRRDRRIRLGTYVVPKTIALKSTTGSSALLSIRWRSINVEVDTKLAKPDPAGNRPLRARCPERP